MKATSAGVISLPVTAASTESPLLQPKARRKHLLEKAVNEVNYEAPGGRQSLTESSRLIPEPRLEQGLASGPG